MGAHQGRWSEWRELERPDYAGGFGGADVTPPPDYGRLPPKPLDQRRSVTGSSAGQLIRDRGGNSHHGPAMPTKAYTPPPPRKPPPSRKPCKFGPQSPEHKANMGAAMRAAWARRKAALLEKTKCPAPCES